MSARFALAFGIAAALAIAACGSGGGSVKPAPLPLVDLLAPLPGYTYGSPLVDRAKEFLDELERDNASEIVTDVVVRRVAKQGVHVATIIAFQFGDTTPAQKRFLVNSFAREMGGNRSVVSIVGRDATVVAGSEDSAVVLVAGDIGLVVYGDDVTELKALAAMLIPAFAPPS